MLAAAKRVLKQTRLYYPLFRCSQFIAALRYTDGPPPPIIKQRILRQYAKEYGLRVFVETGTYLGNTVAALRDCFDRLYSIELDEALCARAAKRFRSSPHIEILQGDSAAELPRLLDKIKQPALFWLDSHASGGETAKAISYTPILEELRAILTAQIRHVVLIDDAGSFCGTYDYPTLEELERFVKSLRNDMMIEVRQTIIRIVPNV
jgi:hypothetical protein